MPGLGSASLQEDISFWEINYPKEFSHWDTCLGLPEDQAQPNTPPTSVNLTKPTSRHMFGAIDLSEKVIP